MATELVVAPAEDTTEAEEVERPYHVFLWNDPVTPMAVVTYALMKVFSYPKERAERLMLTAHEEGKAVVWTGGRDQARHYCVQLGLFGLQATVGRAS
jgi:ATP-dependent Clp protease adaptor protein ClpS